MKQRNVFLQMGTEIDPATLKASVGDHAGEIKGRTPEGTQIFADAFRLRDYVYHNQNPEGENVYKHDTEIKQPETDGLSGKILSLNWSLPRPLRAATNLIYNTISGVINGVKNAYSSVVSTVFGRTSSALPENPVVKNHPLEGSMEIRPAKDGYEVETIEDGQKINAFFAAETRPGKLCGEVITGAEDNIELSDVEPEQDAVTEPVEKQEKQVAVESEKPDQEVDFDAVEVPDHILEEYAMGSDVESEEMDYAGEVVPEMTEEVEVSVDPAPSYELPDILSPQGAPAVADTVIPVSAEQFRQGGEMLPETPSLEDPFIVDVDVYEVSQELNESNILAICAEVEPELPDFYEVDVVYRDGDTDGSIQLRHQSEYALADFTESEKRLLESLAADQNVKLKAEEVNILSDHGPWKSFFIGETEYSARHLLQAVGDDVNEPGYKISSEVLDRCVMTDELRNELDQGSGEAMPENNPSSMKAEPAPHSEVFVPSEEVPETEDVTSLEEPEKSISDIFYQHEIPGDPKRKKIKM